MARAWDAGTYDRVSGPQQSWSTAVLDRLELRGDERVLDAGCGSGRVTERLLDRLPRGSVVAVDADAGMVERARELLGDRAQVLLMDLLDLDLDAPVDAVFSNAVFHWVLDHDALWRRVHAALRPGGRVSVQCGGAGNCARFRAIADEVIGRPDPEPWNFATPEDTAVRLEAAGFTGVQTWLHPAPAEPDEPHAFVRTVVLGPYLEQLDPGEHDRAIDEVLARVGEPVVLDYVRLNVVARAA
jgi:trans-aconitate 2-methyltransferase